MKEKFYRFMQGRYGVDDFSKFLLGVGIACMVLDWIFKVGFLSILCWAALIYVYFRMLSKNTTKRYEEEQAFERVVYKVKNFFKGDGRTKEERKAFKVYLCPGCRQKIRVPRGKGKIEITCPKCKTTFLKRT